MISEMMLTFMKQVELKSPIVLGMSDERDDSFGQDREIGPTSRTRSVSIMELS